MVAKWSITDRLHVHRRWRLDTSRLVLVDNHQAFTPSAVLEVLEGSVFHFIYIFSLTEVIRKLKAWRFYVVAICKVQGS